MEKMLPAKTPKELEEMGEWAVPQEGGTGGRAGLPLGDGIFTTNPAPPPSPGHTFNRVTMSRTYQVQVDFCGNSYCLDPKRQAQMQVQTQAPEEVRSEIWQQKGWGQVLGHEIGGWAKFRQVFEG